MARRAHAFASFLDGFNSGYDLVGRVMRDRELAGVARATPEETPGEAIDADPQALQDQLDSGAGMGEARRLAGAGVGTSTYSLLGKKQDTPFTPAEVSAAKREAQIGVLERHGDIESADRMRERSQAMRVRDLQMSEAEKASKRGDIEWARKEKAIATEEAYKADMERVFQESPMGRKASEYAQQVNVWQQENNEYIKRRDAGDTTAVAPARPIPPMLSPSENLLVGAQVLAAKVKHGMAKPEDIMSYGEKMMATQKEGYVRALRLAQSGAPLTAVVEAFNANGDQKFDPTSIIEDKTVTRDGVKSRLITFKRPDGSTSTVDTMASLNEFQAAGDLFQQAYQAHTMRNQDAHLRLQQGAAGRAAAEQAAGEPERKLRATIAQTQLDAMGDDPAKATAAKAKLEAIGKGIGAGDKDQPAEVKLARALMQANPGLGMKEALKEAMTRQGSSPEDVHMRIVESGVKSGVMKPAEAVKQADEVMASMGYTKGKRGWTQAGESSGADIWSDARAVAIRDDKTLSIEQKRAKLKALGY